MKTSELINALHSAMNMHGDLEIAIKNFNGALHSPASVNRTTTICLSNSLTAEEMFGTATGGAEILAIGLDTNPYK